MGPRAEGAHHRGPSASKVALRDPQQYKLALRALTDINWQGSLATGAPDQVIKRHHHQMMPFTFFEIDTKPRGPKTPVIN